MESLKNEASLTRSSVFRTEEKAAPVRVMDHLKLKLVLYSSEARAPTESFAVKYTKAIQRISHALPNNR